MRHYGEDRMKAHIFPATFAIELRNHHTGAAITITGPRRGIFERPDVVVGRQEALMIGRELARVLRRVTH